MYPFETKKHPKIGLKRVKNRVAKPAKSPRISDENRPATQPRMTALPDSDSPDIPTSPIPPADGEGPPLFDPLDIAEELRDSYLTYAMSVIVSRALPDVRDGLKPSQRRILVAMNDLNLTPGSQRIKCAKICGDTSGNYHPHGEAGVYPTLVRMAQEWNLRQVLIDKQGNFGSIAGLPPAAMRYTEARLAPAAAELLADLDRDTVDMMPNYDNRRVEPIVLPGKFPNLLVNGSDGIAVGMATEIPSHNLREVCDGLIALIDNPDITLLDLIAIIPGPDYPTGGIIMGRQGILDGYRTGRGKVTLRARAEIVEERNRSQIIIKEVPFQVSRMKLMADIGELVKDERIKGISAVRDESSARTGEPVRVVIDLKRDADPQLILNQLYQFSSLQRTASIILLALVDSRPKVMTLKEMMQEYLRHRTQVIRRRTEYMLREAKRRAHVLEGQLIAISSLDEVIAICRSSPSRAEAKNRLMGLAVSAAVLQRAIGDEAFAALQEELGTLTEYRMTEAQSEAVVNLRLGQLAALERDEIYKEYSGLRTEIRAYQQLLSSEANILNVVRDDLTELRDKFGDDRRTEISDAGGDIDIEDLIAEEIQAVTISHQGYIKRLPLNTYRTQHRGGKGVTGAATREDDFVEHFFTASTHAYLLCFTNIGRVYWLKVYDIPQMSRTSAGRAIANVLSFKGEEKITSVIPVREFEGDACLLMATNNGTVKKTDLMAYSRPKQGGIIGISLEEGDSLISVVLTRPGDEVVVSSRKGKAIRFSESDARSMGRNTKGVRGIKLASGDSVVGMVVADPEGYLLTVCENGFGKRTPFGANAAGDEPELETEEADNDEPEPEELEAEMPPENAEGEPLDGAETPRSQMRYRRQRRGGKGVIDIRTSERNGLVVSINAVREGDQIIVITEKGMVNRTKVDEIRIVGRNTQGVRIMNVDEGDSIVTAAKIVSEDME
jgi:DNA gyrase subunit A